MGKITGVLSLKGGVGKTSSVAALGYELSKIGKKVLLVDANFSAPNLGLHFNLVDPDFTLNHVIARLAKPGQAIYNLNGIDVLPSSLFWKKPINHLSLKDKLRPLKRKYDHILIDSSPALNDETLAVMLASDNLFVVTTPDIPTLSTTMKAVSLAKKRDTNIHGLILNKVYNKNFEIPLKDVESTAEVPILAVIPYDIGFPKSLSSFTPYTAYNSKSRGSVEFRKLAHMMSGQRYKGFDWNRFLKIPPKKHEINREIYYESLFE